MLRKPAIGEAEGYLNRAYELALDPTRSGYPTYLDGIKTKLDFENTVRRGLEEERDHEVLLYEEGGKLAGLICFFYIPDEHFLQTVVFNIEGNTQNALEEFADYCGDEFPGYELYLGFPKDNRNAVAYFESNGWNLLEHSYNDVLHFVEYAPVEIDAPIAKVTRDNFADFRRLHEPIEGDMYWNCDRLHEKLDDWTIWLYYQKEEPCAAIYYKDESILTEIFGVDFLDGKFDSVAFRMLLRTALNDCKAKGCEHMVFFNDDESQQVTLDLGFRCVGEYLLCYKEGLRKELLCVSLQEKPGVFS